MGYVCLNHSIIHFYTDIFDKLKYLSRKFFLIAIFLEKGLVDLPKQMEI